MSDLNIYIIRHGQTDMNRAECLQGQIDCELNHTGIEEAESAFKRLKSAGIVFERIYSSPLKRALETARILSNGRSIEAEPLLTEMHFGDYEGRPYKDIDKAMWDFIHSPETVAPPKGVESIQSLCDRTGRFLERLLKEEISGNVLIVTHGIALRSILWNLSSPKDRSRVWSMGIENCVIYRLTVKNGIVCGIRKADELSQRSESDTSAVF